MPLVVVWVELYPPTMYIGAEPPVLVNVTLFEIGSLQM